MSPPVITVRADVTGTWYVYPDDQPAPVSAHPTETDAERAALARAAEHRETRVVVIDRYLRAHEIRQPDRRHAGAISG